MNTTDLRAARRLAAAARNLTLAGLCLAAPSLAQQWVEAGDGAVARSFPDRNASAVARPCSMILAASPLACSCD